MDILAQLIGILAMGFNIFSYQFKRKRNVLLFQMIGGALFSVNMFMLGAVSGGILNVIAAIRAITYICVERYQWKTAPVNAVFMTLYVISYATVFTVFNTPAIFARFLVELLPVIGMVALNIGFAQKDARAVRICGSISSPCWLAYNCINFSIGGIICEVISIFSIVTAFLRLDKKKKEVQ